MQRFARSTARAIFVLFSSSLRGVCARARVVRCSRPRCFSRETNSRHLFGHNGKEHGEEEKETELQTVDGMDRARLFEWARRHRGTIRIAEVREDEAQAPPGLVVNGKEKGKRTGAGAGHEGEDMIDSRLGGLST